MRTAESLIKDSFVEIFAIGQEQPLEASEFQQGIRYLNDMMTELDALGISLGYTVVSEPDDIITVPDGAINGVKFNLAVSLAQSHQKQVTPGLAVSARNGMRAMRRIALKVKARNMPCTMPVGSGNEWDGNWNDRFYPCPEDEILTEDDGSILLETNTNA